MTDDIVIRPLASGEAEALRDCFVRAYGDSYVFGLFYDPDQVRAWIGDGRLRSVVAVASDGDIVGHMALTKRSGDDRTADAGNTVVDPRYRKRNLAGRLALSLLELSAREGLVGFHQYPTTIHPVMQKLTQQGGGFETGVMLDYTPAGTDFRGFAGTERARPAVTIAYQVIGSAPSRTVFLPERYADVLADIYRPIGLAREVRTIAASCAEGEASVDASLDRRRGVLRIDVASIGAGWLDEIDRLMRRNDEAVLQVDLRLSHSAVLDAVEPLRKLGFFFSGLLPEYRQGDILRMQKLRSEEALRRPPNLVNPDTQRILRFLLDDAKSLN